MIYKFSVNYIRIIVYKNNSFFTRLYNRNKYAKLYHKKNPALLNAGRDFFLFNPETG